MKRLLLPLLLAFAASAGVRAADRATLPLDGAWEIEDSVAADCMPVQFTHLAPVPGLAHLARPAFPDVDRYDSRQVVANLIGKGRLPESARIAGLGVPRQDRNYFWYRRTFRAPARREVALLRIGKAQFGTAVWLNGRKLGEHAGCFTAGCFDLSAAIDWRGDNVLVVRIGAHPSAMPADTPAGADSEKILWTPGIYDSVALVLADDPVIETVQIAPQVAPRQVAVQATIHNYAAAPRRGAVAVTVREWKSGRRCAEARPVAYALAPGETRVVTATVALPGGRLWSPDDPFLYTADVATSGDDLTTRFGLREFRSDSAHRRFELNGRTIYLRGSNITLHRFFEDPQSGALPWDEAWVRKLLIDLPHRMHWNAFRFCIGPVPDRWLDIADEAGLLIQQEYPIWTGPKPGNFPAAWTDDLLHREYREFVRDNANHPSVAIWGACNETVSPRLAPIINAVRPLDLSSRPWDNGFNPPAGPNDPVDAHPYERWRDGQDSTLAATERARGVPHGEQPLAPGHTVLVNEYGWLWLDRAGNPTILTRKLYDAFVGPRATADERFHFQSYYLAALTEYWRAYRQTGGVLHFVYLTGSHPGAFTGDNFRDVISLELEPHFADYVSQAFQPVGVYVNLWRRRLPAGDRETLPVILINDHDRPVSGMAAMVLEDAAGRALERRQAPFGLPALGRQELAFPLTVPSEPGHYRITVEAQGAPALPEGSTRSRREFEVAGAATPP